LLLAARRGERGNDRRLLAPALVAGADDERSRRAVGEEAPVAAPNGRRIHDSFATMIEIAPPAEKTACN
jgi:hypothetical protein